MRIYLEIFLSDNSSMEFNSANLFRYSYTRGFTWRFSYLGIYLRILVLQIHWNFFPRDLRITLPGKLHGDHFICGFNWKFLFGDYLKNLFNNKYEITRVLEKFT